MTDAGVGVFNGAVVLVTGALLSTGVVVPLLLKDGSAVVLGLSTAVFVPGVADALESVGANVDAVAPAAGAGCRNRSRPPW